MCIYTVVTLGLFRHAEIEVDISSLNFQHQTDFYDLFWGKMKKRTGPLRVAAQKHEYLLAPERHARLRRREKRETA
jgi:hypothetical protein